MASQELMETANHSVKQVKKIAKRTAQKEDISMGQYSIETIDYKPESKNHWTVFFEGHPKLIGDHFLVWVNDKTGEAQLMWGE